MGKAGKIVAQIVLLYILHSIGITIQKLLDVPIPGSIIAMLLLFLLLTTNVINDKWLADGGRFLLSYLPLLFVPATVGIIDYLPLFKGSGILSVIVVVVSTVMVMLAAGIIGQWGALWQDKKRRQISEDAKERIEA